MKKIVLLCFCLLTGLPVQAHHGWSSYDASKVMNFSAKVLKSSYENPHGSLQVDYQGKTWTVILAPVSRMQARGLTAEMIQPGADVQILGYPSKEKKPELRAESITVNNKKVELR
ncbi:DUF6152 family protein [Bdellovibrio sp. 22V]|uniref:DUF6152 family protein n=1 Tax=Bdellovibrio TaxID=958 RepID=UPI0025429E5A|nr:DUF6152 family protein [Bdellovibrio sp. 22V]WII73573.1 DUF6152 family protein [Bdellovibrio sp. 22V]